MAVSRTRKKKKNQNRTTPAWEGRTVYGMGKELQDAGGPSRRNIEVGQRAAEGDRVWFDKNPGASVRAREALPGEHDHRAFGPEPLAPNQKIAVVVVQAAPGRRTRIPFQVVTTATAGAAISPQQLEEVRAEWESGDQTAPLMNQDSRVVDGLALMRALQSMG
ncbi:hypothetical protein [Streptomyces sp. WZ-12]|uniref:hypothetical protein n=1 Tax=Streptomyces sp. WZ-12 TaxID=3030210 RepID=UPI0023811240|nr:hypothetical protein [Streptomyces sp. WZ-12]